MTCLQLHTHSVLALAPQVALHDTLSCTVSYGQPTYTDDTWHLLWSSIMLHYAMSSTFMSTYHTDGSEQTALERHNLPYSVPAHRQSDLS